MDGVNKVDFFVNVFPSPTHDWEIIKCDADRKVIYVRHLYEFHSSLDIKVVPKYWCFTTDRVFLNCCQEEIYSTVIEDIIDNAFLGVNSVVLSYGQNCSGKTFTITGFRNQFNLRGIVPRFVIDLLAQKKIREYDFSSQVWLSVVDIFGDSVYDLLKNTKTKCRDENDVRKVRIKSDIQCLELLFKAEANRIVVDEQTYNAHSASNIITFTVKTIPLNCQDPCNKLSKINFIDLAGVETILRNPKTSIKDKTVQGVANLTKTMLEISALQSPLRKNLSKNRTHSVTKYLGNSLSPSSVLKLVCHIRPHKEDIGITMSLLKFGMVFLNNPRVRLQPHLEIDEGRLIKNLEEEIRMLKDDAMIKSYMAETSPIFISQERMEFIRRSIVLFLSNQISEQELLSLVNDCSLILRFIRIINEGNTIDNLSIALQTDEEYEFQRKIKKEPSLEKSESGYKIESPPKTIEQPKPELKEEIRDKKTKSDKSRKSTAKTGKGKKEKKAVKVEPILTEAGVQVNLVEPKNKLPKLDSRESLWALFMISNPDIQARLDKLSGIISKKEKNYNKELEHLDRVKNTLNNTELELNKLASYRHTEGGEMYDQDGRILISNEESEMAKQSSDLKKEFIAVQQKLLEVQSDWLDSLDKLNCEKQIVERKFEDFCTQLNLLAIDTDQAYNDNVSEKLIREIAPESMINPNLQEKYFNSGQQSFEDEYRALQKEIFKFIPQYT